MNEKGRIEEATRRRGAKSVTDLYAQAAYWRP